MTKIAFFGAAGKMGKRLVALGAADSELEIVAALEAPTCPDLGRDAGEVAGIAKIGVPITAELPADVTPDVIVDFSSPRALDALLALCLDRKIALVYATTGADAEQLQRLEDASKTIPVLRSPSMSPSVNLAMKLTQIAAKALKDQDADVEILERHHRYKVDAPSGTALKFGSLIAAEMGIDSFRDGRGGKTGARPHNEIAYHAIRVGDNPGEHTIVFGMLGETLEVTVRASNRDAYATGALAAAKFLAARPAGRLYDMNDVLQL